MKNKHSLSDLIIFGGFQEQEDGKVLYYDHPTKKFGIFENKEKAIEFARKNNISLDFENSDGKNEK